MQALTNSAFLQALGYAIANSLWQMALLWIVALMLSSFIKSSSATKYRIAVAAQLLGFAWFTITFQFYYIQCSNALKVSNELVGHQHFKLIVPDAGNTVQSNLVSFLLKGEQLLPYLSAAYLLLLVFLIVKWTRCYKHAQNVRNNGLHKIHIDWKLFVKNIAGHLGIKQEVKIYLSELVNTPMTVGFLKPIILVPMASINHLSTEQMEAVLLHELAHIKRFDYLLNLILSIAETALFFNPFTQLLGKTIRKERENSCDDWVLQFQYSPSMYAEALLRIAYMQSSPAFAMALSGKKDNDLLTRVKRMIDSKESGFNYRHQLLALLLMTGILSSIAWLQPISKNQQMARANANDLLKTKKTLIKEPMLANVSNPLFNPVFFLQKPIKDQIEKTVETVTQDLLSAKRHQEDAQKELAAVMPIAAKNLEDIDWEEVDNDVQDGMKEANAQIMNLQLSHPASPAPPSAPAYDSVRYTSVFNQHFDYNYNYGFNNDAFKKNWKQMTEEMRKVGTELAKAVKSKNVAKIKEWQQYQTEISNAMSQFKSFNVPYKVSFSGMGTVSTSSKENKAARIVVEDEKQRAADQVKMRHVQVSAQTSSLRNRQESVALAKRDAEARLTSLKGKLDATSRAPVCYAGNIIPEVVPYLNTSNNYTYAGEDEPKKKTASRVSITTSSVVDSKIKTTATGSSASSGKRYEIVVTGKDGVEKKIVVVVED